MAERKVDPAVAPETEEEKAERVRRFEEATRKIREAFSDLDITEEELLEQGRQIRRELYEERYGKKSKS